MTRNSELERFEQLARDVTVGDLSMLQAAARDDSVVLTTTAGTANDKLWSAMAAASWVAEIEAPALPHGLPLRFKSFKMLPEATAMVVALVERISAEKSLHRSA